jgi:tRNA-splicing ligase RtcB (3'-phosphate/5'-hydroxy nucleic acid ligase)
MIVHRKGATPAGVLGIVPGTMADPGYLTLSLGAEESLNSAAHGARRRMRRTRAFKELDEAPAACKDPRTVMGSQADLVEAVGEFSRGIVRMDAGNRKDRRRRRTKNPRPREGR